MCEWKSCARWKKELLGLCLTGFFLVLLLSVILFHLQTNMRQQSENQSKFPSYNRVASQVTHVNMFDPTDLAVAVSPFVDKLKWYDILIFLLLWPVGVMFSKFSQSCSRRIYKLLR